MNLELNNGFMAKSQDIVRIILNFVRKSNFPDWKRQASFSKCITITQYYNQN